MAKFIELSEEEARACGVAPVVRVEVEEGPMIRAGFDLLEFAVTLLDLLPDWAAAQREELTARADLLNETLGRCLDEMRSVDVPRRSGGGGGGGRPKE